jgi:hypothetical protein
VGESARARLLLMLVYMRANASLSVTASTFV